MGRDIENNLISNKLNFPPSNLFELDASTTLPCSLTLKFKLFVLKALTALGLAMGLMLTTANDTAVTSVASRISSDLIGSGSTSIWISGSYSITAVAFNPLFGKLSNIFGRKNALCFCHILFIIGCLGSALAVDFPMFIVFRVISGIAGGGYFALSYIMVPDVIPLLDRPLFYGIVNISFGVSALIGPIIGPAIGSHSWRNIFYVFIPFCVLDCLIAIFVMPLPKPKGTFVDKLKRVDWFGCISIILFLIGIVSICNLGGNIYPWNSAPVIVIICLSVVFLLAFIYIETKVSVEPILPLEMFNRNTIFVNLATFFLGTINFAGIAYFPIYYQTIQNYSISNSVYLTAPFLILTGVFCMISGFIAKHFNSGREVMWVGGIFQIIAVTLLGVIPVTAPLGQFMGYIILSGIGVGFIKQLVVMVCQKTSSKEYVAIITGFATFSHCFGRAVGLAIINRVYNYIYIKEITQNLPKFSPQDLALPSIIESLTLEEKNSVIYSYMSAFKYSYLSLIPFASLCFISLLFLTKWPPMTKPPNMSQIQTKK
jgi:MFS family permease